MVSSETVIWISMLILLSILGTGTFIYYKYKEKDQKQHDSKR